MTLGFNCSPTSSIGKKQCVALTGFLLIGFVIGHLAGNLFIYGGPEAFNGYAHKLAHLRPGLYLVEAILLVLFFVHIYVTALLVYENLQARPHRYKIREAKGQRSLATQWMPCTGTIIVLFVIWHLSDFTFIDHSGPRSFLADGKSYELYGVVYNSFLDPLHSMAYIVAMIAVGFHLSHALQSLVQTFGFNHPVYTPIIRKASNTFGALVTLGYSSVPIYISLKTIL